MLKHPVGIPMLELFTQTQAFPNAVFAVPCKQLTVHAMLVMFAHNNRLLCECVSYYPSLVPPFLAPDYHAHYPILVTHKDKPR